MKDVNASLKSKNKREKNDNLCLNCFQLMLQKLSHRNFQNMFYVLLQKVLKSKKSCKNEAKEKFIRIRTDGWLLFAHVRKVELKRLKLAYFWCRTEITKLLFVHK